MSQWSLHDRFRFFPQRAFCSPAPLAIIFALGPGHAVQAKEKAAHAKSEHAKADNKDAKKTKKNDKGAKSGKSADQGKAAQMGTFGEWGAYRPGQGQNLLRPGPAQDPRACRR